MWCDMGKLDMSDFYQCSEYIMSSNIIGFRTRKRVDFDTIKIWKLEYNAGEFSFNGY